MRDIGRTALVISAASYLERIGTDQERKRDRKFCYALSMWHWRHKWRLAEQTGDYSLMDALDRELAQLNAL